MDGVDVSDLSRGDNGGHVEITLGGARRADADGLVGKLHVQRVAVSLAVDGYGADAELPARVEDAESDFTAIGYEDFTEHGL